MNRQILTRYASALFGQAQSAGVVELVESDLGLISFTFEANPRLQSTAESPVIPAVKKKEILKEVFQNKIHEIALHYLYLLVDNRREDLIGYTEKEYVNLANKAGGVVAADVTAAVGLTEEEIAKLGARLQEHTGRGVRIQVTVDPLLIGGLVVRIADHVMDGSIAGHLERIKEQFYK